MNASSIEDTQSGCATTEATWLNMVFAVVELVVVIPIVAILTTILYPVFAKVRREAKVARSNEDLSVLALLVPESQEQGSPIQRAA